MDAGSTTMFDAIIIGGSYAGMAAALQLARARRTVLVIDAGERRNRFAASSHGLLGQDGRSPAEIANEARAQLLKYPNVTWVEGAAIHVEKSGDEFIVHSDAGEVLNARRLVLATGVRDELPEIPGLAERWGKLVFHCPYCHGYELDNGPLGVLATGEMSMHQALLIPEWGPTTFFTNEVIDPDEDQVRQLEARNVSIKREPVSEITGTGTMANVNLRDGRIYELAGLFVASTIKPASPAAEALGCELMETPLGTIIKTDEMKGTSVEGAFACGDLARAAGSITFAIADGAMAGMAVHRSQIFSDLG
ncbi:MAG: NAD(P)/FAD-dependent oxidoreductase [Thermomicrobiaceae bacterium]